MKKLCYAFALTAAIAGFTVTANAAGAVSSIMDSYEKNAENSYTVDYLEEDLILDGMRIIYERSKKA